MRAGLKGADMVDENAKKDSQCVMFMRRKPMTNC